MSMYQKVSCELRKMVMKYACVCVCVIIIYRQMQKWANASMQYLFSCMLAHCIQQRLFLSKQVYDYTVNV